MSISNESTPSLAHWQQRLGKMAIRSEAFRNGRFVPALSGKTFDCINPATNEIIARVAACDSEDVDCAVKDARRAFDSGVWSRMAPAKRKAIMLRFTALILDYREDFAVLESIDMGKLVQDAYTLDVPAAAEVFQWFAESIDKQYGETASVGEAAHATITREPIGVVGAVVPWNFPLKMAAWKCAPALACGNSVILKPAEQSPLSALLLAELASRAGVPDGVFQVLPGFGETAGRAIGLHPDIDCVAFTGSTEVGKYFLRYASESNMKQVWLECGGKSPNIVFPDCNDLYRAARFAAQGIFFNQGEVCSATSRLLVHKSIKDEFVELLLRHAPSFHPGNPLDPASGLGAMVDENHTRRVMNYVELGKRTSRLILGGTRLETSGCFITPTIFDDVSETDTLAREEIFGPVLSIMSFEAEEEALSIANDSIYGLGASLWTNDLNRAHRVSRALRVGSVSVNTVDNVSVQTPFGGVRQSGNGRDLSLHALDKYATLKTTWIAL
jgi:gamma-glutamyl-gamma-aminobutyraldehyde dehydrogenase